MPSVAALDLSSGGFNFFPYPLTFLFKPSKMAANSTFQGGKMKAIKIVSLSLASIIAAAFCFFIYCLVAVYDDDDE
jgi:hypothetical protein